MFRHIEKLGCLMALVAGVFFPPLVHAQTVPHKERAVGTITDVGDGVLFFAGEGRGTHFGKYQIEGSNEFDDEGNVFNGEFTTTAADGSTISGEYDGFYEVSPAGEIIFEVYVLWLEGTGRLAGVTGEADVVATLDGLAQGDAFEYVTKGTLTFP